LCGSKKKGKQNVCDEKKSLPKKGYRHMSVAFEEEKEKIIRLERKRER